MRKLLLAAVLAAAISVAAPVAAQEASGDPGGITGFVTGLSGTAVLIEENPIEESGSDKANVAITAETQVFVQRGQDRVPATPEDLAVGQIVEAAFAGPVAESYPVQATAGSITVIEDPNEPAAPPSTSGADVLPDTSGAALPTVVALAGGCLLAAILLRRTRTSTGGRKPSGRTPGRSAISQKQKADG